MHRLRTLSCAATLGIWITAITPSSAAVLGKSLQSKLSGAAATASVGTVIVTFNTASGLNPSHLAALQAAGITSGYTLQKLGMVGAVATAGQVRALANNSAVRSIWLNDRLQYLNNETRVLTGVDKMRTNPNFIRANGGLPISGKGNFSLVINDSGIDGTHPDTHFPEHVIQNVQTITDSATLSGFTALNFIENVPDTDTNVGHGTHCAGIAGGTGAASGGLYAGVAPGVNLIGVGSGAGLFVLNSLGGFEYAIANQARYGIRIISNSWGGQGPFDPNDPVSIASKLAHDLNIIVVFAAGNSGPGKDTMNPYAKAPWVIGVAAGTKEGGLASFSSRGVPLSSRPAGDYNAPAITAPGTGREFASDSARFTSDIISVRAKTNIFANGTTADTEIPVAYLSYYTQISGTSMATPFVAGTVALMLNADATLTPDEVRTFLMKTASQMPGFSEFEVGAGYINVFAAIDKVFHRNKNYGSYGGPVDLQKYNLHISANTVSQQRFHIDFSPVGLPGPGSTNSKNFTVNPGMSILDVSARIDNALTTGDGNTVGLLLTDPQGTKYSSGIMIPILDAPTREVVVNNPVPGQWLLEVRGVRGLAALPEVSLPTSGAAAPGPVDGTIVQQVITLPTIADIQGDSAQAEIEFVLKNRIMDVMADGQFHPQSTVLRNEFANDLVMNTALRQSLADSPLYNDVSGAMESVAEAVTANGSSLRDYDFTPTGMMSPASTAFSPFGNIHRIEVAVALVKALGMDAQAKAKAGSDVTATYNGITVVVSDEAQIPSNLRAYVQIALDRGILNAFFTMKTGTDPFTPVLTATVRPNDFVTRSYLAYALDHYRQDFAAGN